MDAEEWKFQQTLSAHEGQEVKAILKLFVKECPKVFNYFANNEKEYLVSGGGNGKINVYDIQDKWTLKQILSDSTKPI